MDLPTDPFSPTPAPPDVDITSQDQAPVQADQVAQQGHYENLSGIYTPDMDRPNVLGAVATVFGEQRGKGTDPDDIGGGFAYGGRSTNNPTPYIALPKGFNDIIPPGYAVPIWNPDDPSKIVWGVHTDLGPSARGVGIDVAPNVAEALKIPGKGNVQFDPTQAKPMSSEEAQALLAQANANQSGQQASSGQQSGTMSTDSQGQPQATGAKQYPDGSIDYGNGIRRYPNGIIENETSTGIVSYIPDPTKPNGYMIHTAQKKPPPDETKISGGMENEAREAGIDIFNQDGSKRKGVDVQTDLARYYQDKGILPPTLRKEIVHRVENKTSSRSPAYRAYAGILSNYDTITQIAQKPTRTGADDIQLLQAIANIEAPGRSSTKEDMQQWIRALGIAGRLEVTKQRYGAAYDFLTGKMSAKDWEQGGRTLSGELVQQLQDVAERGVQARYRQFAGTLAPTAEFIKKVGGDREYLHDITNPVTGENPFTGEKGEAKPLYAPVAAGPAPPEDVAKYISDNKDSTDPDIQRRVAAGQAYLNSLGK